MDSAEPQTEARPHFDAHDPVADGPQSRLEEDFDWNLDILTNLLSLYVSYITCTWGMIALSVSLTYINEAFPGETSQSSWIAGVIGLAQCVLSLFIGELSDIFGRRYFMVTGNTLLLVGGLISSRAHSVGVIIGGQVLTGSGVAFGYLATPLLSEIVPKRSRSIVISIGTAALGLVASLGAVAIGAFQKYDVGGPHQGWRPAAYLTAGLGFLSLVTTVLFYRPGHRPNPQDLTVMQRLRNIDWLGILIGTAGLTVLLLGLQFGGNPDPWQSAKVLSLILVGCVCLLAFVVWEAKFVTFGLFPRQLFKSRNYPIVMATQFIEGMAINTGVAFLVQIQYLLYTTDTVMTQVRNIPYGTSTVFGSAIAAAVLYFTRETKWVVIASLALGLAGVGMMSTLKSDSSYALWFFGTVFIAISTAGMGVGVVVIASLVTPNELIATALTILQSVRGLGGAVGIVIFSQVFTTKSAKYVPVSIAAAAIGSGLPPTSVEDFIQAIFAQDLAAFAKIPGVTPAVLATIQPAMKQGYAHAFAYMWYSMLPFIGVTLVATWFLKPTKGITTEEVTSKVQPRFNRRHGATAAVDVKVVDDENKDCEAERLEKI